MTDILQADLVALRGLGQQLTGVAGAIKAIKDIATVDMPNSPVGDIAVKSSNTVLGAYLHMSVNVSRMADAANSSATSYEDVDAAFAGELKGYEAGL